MGGRGVGCVGVGGEEGCRGEGEGEGDAGGGAGDDVGAVRREVGGEGAGVGGEWGGGGGAVGGEVVEAAAGEVSGCVEVCEGEEEIDVKREYSPLNSIGRWEWGGER